MSALDTSVLVTFFTSYAAQNKGDAKYTLVELAERIRGTSADAKAELPWLKLARFGNRRSPSGSLRHDANVTAISGIELDYDQERIAFDTAQEKLEKQGVLSLLYTSPSFTEDTPRWRVLCPLSEEAKPAQRRHLLGRLNGLFRGIASRESWTLSQAYYFGSVRNNPSHRVELIAGTPIDQHDDLDETWIGPGTTESTGAPDDITGDERETAELVRRVCTGEEYHTALTPLAARLVGQGAPRIIALEILRGLMLSRPETTHDARWSARYDEIPRLVDSAVGKYAFGAAGRRAIASAVHRCIREKRSFQELRDAAIGEAERHVVTLETARRIICGIIKDLTYAA